jgi:hypothetical protein
VSAYDGFAWGFLAGVLLAVTVARLNRSTMRGAAFGDAADFLRAMAADGRFCGHSAWSPSSALHHAADYLDAWATEPSGGRERMPIYGFKGPLPSPPSGEGAAKGGES